MRMIRVFLVLLSVGVASSSAGAKQTVSLCELLNNPQKYNGTEVVVRATYGYWFETSELRCLPCRDKGRVWLELSNDVDETSEKALKKAPPEGVINVTVQGIFSSGGTYGHLNGYRHQIRATRVSDIVVLLKGMKPVEKVNEAEAKWGCGGQNPR
jgi:hypothetical protein